MAVSKGATNRSGKHNKTGAPSYGIRKIDDANETV